MKMQSVTTNNFSINKKDNKNNIADGSYYKVIANEIYPNAEPPRIVKIGTAATTLIGVATAMFLTFRSLSKGQTEAAMKEANNLIPMKGVSSYFKNLVHIKYDKDENACKHELAFTVARLGVGSVGGGLLGGFIFDKKDNRKAKLREAVIQLLGNIATPLICVETLGTIFKKHVTPKIIEKFKLKSAVAKGLPGAISSGIILISAIFAGNKIGNKLNRDLFGIDDRRKLKPTDMLPHVDDLCMTLSLMMGDTPISKIIPAALTIAGYSTGTAQEKPAIKAQLKIIEAKNEREKALKHHNNV